MLCKYSYLQAPVNRDIFIAFVYICNFQVSPENIKFQTVNQSGHTVIFQNSRNAEKMEKYLRVWQIVWKNESQRLLFQIWKKTTKVTNVMIYHVDKCTVKRS